MSTQPPMDNPSVTISYRVPLDIRQELEAEAKAEGKTLSSYMSGLAIIRHEYSQLEVKEVEDEQKTLSLVSLVGDEVEGRSETMKSELLEAFKALLAEHLEANSESLGTKALELKEENIEMFNQSQWDEERASQLETELVNFIESYNQLKMTGPMLSNCYVRDEDTSVFMKYFEKIMIDVAKGDFLTKGVDTKSITPAMFIMCLLEASKSYTSDLESKVRKMTKAIAGKKTPDNYAVGMQHMEEIIEAAVEDHKLVLSTDEGAE